MTDLHCHILPGIDDGAKDEQASLELLRREWSDGVRNIAFTSHFHFERTTLEEYLHYRNEAYSRLLAAVAGTDMKFNFKLGAEVYFSSGLNSMNAKALCIENTNYMLMEFHTSHRPHFIIETLDNLVAAGITPIIAHVERYSYAMEDLTLVSEWVEAGAVIQTNAGSIIRNDKTTKTLLKMIKWDLVHLISTDTHSMDKRPPKMLEALKIIDKKLGRDTVERLVSNGDKVFNNIELDIDEVYYPRKFLGNWR